MTESRVAQAQALKHPAAITLLADRNGSPLQRYVDHCAPPMGFIRFRLGSGARNSIGPQHTKQTAL